ncbi:hypothetical protein [Nocardiopsis ansamitocini]|uniref:Uncharacterized protein n=1 Tax=Nocardiopsis ansamitocini TaxID=1670832 RepID=A0A9W6P6M6_9ACTN|nr:hypothetical protein [Nocardiopsis ansamitocini]GLU48042.1 hypothetical protein Nans01_23930 [Nocardiopsis ansamitocini]
MLRAARALLAIRHPLDAELVVSELLGAWRASRIPGVDIEQVLGEGLLDYARQAATPAALALLAGVAALGSSHRHRSVAMRGARSLVEQGIARPTWGGSPALAHPVEAHLSRSKFGDADELVCTFRRDHGHGPDATEHALITIIDHNAGGILRDAWVSTKVDQLLEHCTEEASSDPMRNFTQISHERAHTLLTSALERTDRLVAATPDEGPGYEPAGPLLALLPLIRARARTLPREQPGRSGAWRRDRRATLAARFLASSAASDLSDSYAASRCADHIIDYGCDADFGRPLRMSPRKVDAFMLNWLPRRVVLLPEEQEAMPHVLAAWIRWAGPFQGLPEIALHATVDAVWEATAVFSRSYWDPSSAFGLRREVMRRLLPDGDLAALPRRMFAFPLLAGDLLSENDGDFDPTTAAGRRALLLLDHFGAYDDPRPARGRHSAGEEARHDRQEVDEEAVAAHERLADRLWRGDPANLWSAAQRLLDRGHTRPAVLESLLDAIAEAEDEESLSKGLDEL